MIAFHKNTSLKQLIGINTIRNNQKVFTPTQTTTRGQCTHVTPVNHKTTTFTSTHTRESFTIFHKSLAIVAISSTY